MMRSEKVWMGLVVGMFGIAMSGCVFSSTSDDSSGAAADTATSPESTADTSSTAGEEAPATSEPSPGTEPAAESASAPLSSDSVSSSSMFPGLGGVTWLHHNVSSWPQTANLSASVRGSTLRLNYDKANSWPVGYPIGGVALVGNAWVFFQQDGKWYGGTFEWLKPGQIDKQKSAVNGGQIGVSPVQGWRPQSGEVYGFMVSGFARSSTRNIQERSNVSFLTWP